MFIYFFFEMSLLKLYLFWSIASAAVANNVKFLLLYLSDGIFLLLSCKYFSACTITEDHEYSAFSHLPNLDLSCVSAPVILERL